ncbi:hypothetical protein H8356DRAFT_1709441 [Neocallimastix lanati (nom. inval.)]|jgi:hypothetical protein|uniref:Uncharacterized protein n=1 Tax=Neocallimastix californiae TaxID=1754190 RepID=A0A1Y2DJI9_9FUNG|nr:hypothetical protein H8356DRAFT_1709441 [Neocallimastix sp. JGI-2020a]ORY59392.1 hypothetical protein LY90DRAFT_701429 [Neocallimastix californiae]|eukprot:ORY59392.1 hypothetical protein LY90DRAFT_701429 [Neocallimastix californiae]
MISKSKTFLIILVFIILLDNSVNSQFIKLDENQYHVPKRVGTKIKRGWNPLESDYFIFALCIAIPLIFVGIVVTLVSYAKKAYDKAELKRAQNTNASSLSSMNLFSSKNYMNSHSTNNGSSNRSIATFESNQIMDPFSLNNNNSNNNLNSNYNINSNLSTGISTDAINNNNIALNVNGNTGNENNNLDFNTQLLMSKNYRIQGYGASSLSRSLNITSPKLQSSSLIFKDLRSNVSPQKFQIDNHEGTTPVMSEIFSKETIMNNYTPMKPYSNHRSELPPIPGSNKKTYDKSYNEIKKNENVRISVSKPLKDWDDSYITVQKDRDGDQKNKLNGFNKNTDINNGFFGKDSLSPLNYQSPSFKLNNKSKQDDYNKYIMPLDSNKSSEIIDQYLENSVEYKDNNMKNINMSSSTSLTYVPDEILYNSPINYPKKI